MWIAQSPIFSRVLCCGLAYAVASLSTPAMICRAIPVVKPVITAVDTKLITEPSRNSPNSAITMPTSRVRVAMLPGSVGSRPAWESTLWLERAIALVRVVVIKTVRANTAPTRVGAIPE